MSSDDDFPVEEIDLPGLDTEEGRDEVIEYLMSSDDLPSQCSVILEGANMVMRVRYPDGNEELFDLIVRRSKEIPAGRDPSEAN